MSAPKSPGWLQEIAADDDPELELLIEKANMGEQEKRCGTCAYGQAFDSDQLRLTPYLDQWVRCSWKSTGLPTSLLSAQPVSMQKLAGTNCPCWQPKKESGT